MDKIAEPNFIEPKGYVFVGYSRKRMTMENMPSVEELEQFSKELAEKMGMEIVGSQPPSRVFVLGDGTKLSLR